MVLGQKQRKMQLQLKKVQHGAWEYSFFTCLGSKVFPPNLQISIPICNLEEPVKTAKLCNQNFHSAIWILISVGALHHFNILKWKKKKHRNSDFLFAQTQFDEK